MRALALAYRSLVHRRARAALGMLGVAAAGALMFDMLLLSRGLLISVRGLLETSGFDVRVLASEGLAQSRAPLTDAAAVVAALEDLPEVATVVPFRIERAEVADRERMPSLTLVGVGPTEARVWTMLDGRDLAADPADPAEVVINRRLATKLEAVSGTTLVLRGRCSDEPSVLPPVTVRVAGIADFPFESTSQLTVAGRLPLLERLCDTRPGEADVLLVASQPEAGPDAAVAAIRRARPDVFAFSNDDVIERFEQVGFSYFRQVSTALSVVTLAFGALLVTVLLTVSVNQRLGEIAALRAIGFSRRRAMADVLWESALLVGVGGAAAIPLGLALSTWLDAILRSFPGVPEALHFFVFEARAVWLHVALLGGAAVMAAAYPLWLVVRLPIAATLRREIVS